MRGARQRTHGTTADPPTPIGVPDADADADASVARALYMTRAQVRKVLVVADDRGGERMAAALRVPAPLPPTATHAHGTHTRRGAGLVRRSRPSSAAGQP